MRRRVTEPTEIGHIELFGRRLTIRVVPASMFVPKPGEHYVYHRESATVDISVCEGGVPVALETVMAHMVHGIMGDAPFHLFELGRSFGHAEEVRHVGQR
jgi:hypothetical protein